MNDIADDERDGAMEDARKEWLVARQETTANLGKPIEVVDYEVKPLDHIKGSWYIYRVLAKFQDGRELWGSMQGDGNLWAYETFEIDEE